MKTLFVTLIMLLSACTRDRGPLGSEGNPVKFYFVPSVDVRVLEDTSKALKEYLEAHTPYKYSISIPTNFITVVEAFGTGRADAAGLNTFGYALAYEKYGVEARLTTVRNGEATYRGEFLARADSKIKKVEDIHGRKLAYVDPASTSGYVLPAKYLKDRGIKPKDTVFAMRHDAVVSMVYQGQVDAGAAFYVSPVEGEIQDARMLVKAQYPDVEKKISIVALTDPIPNDPVVFRKGVPEEMKQAICRALIQFAETPNGKSVLQKLSGVTALIPATDKDYEKSRESLKAVKQATEEKSP